MEGPAQTADVPEGKPACAHCLAHLALAHLAAVFESSPKVGRREDASAEYAGNSRTSQVKLLIPPFPAALTRW